MTIKITKSFKQDKLIPANEIELGKAYMCPAVKKVGGDIIFIGADIYIAGKTVVAFSLCGEHVVFSTDPDEFIEICLEINASTVS